jgi:kynurenine formamidase
MRATEFKNGIKEIKENLKGLTLQLVHAHGYRPYFNLREFGNAILNEEAKGNDFRVNQVWTSEGILGVKSLNHLAELIKTGKVTAVQFESYYEYKTKEEFIRSFGSLD